VEGDSRSVFATAVHTVHNKDLNVMFMSEYNLNTVTLIRLEKNIEFICNRQNMTKKD